MKATYLTTASGLVLALVLAAPVFSTGSGSEDRAKSGMEQGQKKSWVDEQKKMASKSKTAEKITGSKVINQAGDEIGEVTTVVRDKQNDELHIVVSVGGFLGIGDKEVTLPLRNVELAGNRIQTPLAGTKEELEALPVYQKESYEEVPGDQIVQLRRRDHSIAGRQQRQESAIQAASFGELDTDGDGYLSKDEVEARASLTEQLKEQWENIDRNSDDQLDRSEFSAFEEGDAGYQKREKRQMEEKTPKSERQEGGAKFQGGQGSSAY